MDVFNRKCFYVVKKKKKVILLIFISENSKDSVNNKINYAYLLLTKSFNTTISLRNSTFFPHSEEPG